MAGQTNTVKSCEDVDWIQLAQDRVQWRDGEIRCEDREMWTSLNGLRIASGCGIAVSDEIMRMSRMN